LRPHRGRALALAAVSFAWPALLAAPTGDSMSDSVLLAAIRLVARGTFVLSDERDPRTVFLTEAFDIAVHDGRIYSGVAPGATVIAAPFYFVLRPLFARLGDDVVASRRITRYYAANSRGLGRKPAAHAKDVYLLQIALVWCVMAPLFAAFQVRLHRRLVAAGCGDAVAMVATWAAGGAGLTLYYASSYSRQGLAGLLAWHGVLFLLPSAACGPRAALPAGLLLGTAIAVDYPAAILVVLALAFLLPRLGVRARAGLLAPIAAALALLAAYHWSAFGSPLITPYHARYWFTPEVVARQGIDLAAFQRGRLLGIGWPRPAVMLQLCIGAYKGLFVYAPVLLLGLAGHLTAILRERGPRRTLHAGCLAVFAAYLAFNGALGGAVDPGQARHFWGGLSVLWGPRYLLAVVPFLAAGLTAVPWDHRAVRIVAALLLAVSAACGLLGAMFADLLMSAFAFGPEMDRPLAYAASLLRTGGLRVPLLDSYGAARALQAVLLAGLGVVSVLATVPPRRRSLERGSSAGPAGGET
jgi:hypothetical protein